MKAEKFKELLEKTQKKGGFKKVFGGDGNGGLGSCQYDGITDVLDPWSKYKLSIPQLAALMGATISMGPKTPQNLLIEKFKKDQKRELSEMAKEYPEDKEDVKKSLGKLNKVKTLGGAFSYTRDESWDLWGAAAYFVKLAFPKLKIKSIPKAPGFGPIFNVLAQSENYETGLYCAILMSEYNLDEDDLEDFDT